MIKIKTFNDAVALLGEEGRSSRDLFSVYDLTTQMTNPPKDVVAFLKLRIIAAALNDGLDPNAILGAYAPAFMVFNERKAITLRDPESYMITTDKKTGARLYFCLIGSGPAENTSCGITLLSSDLAYYCGKQFIDIWADLLLR